MNVTVKDVARSVMGHDSFRGNVRLPALEQLMQIALQLVIGRGAAFDPSGVVSIDLGNGFTLECSVQAKETAE